MSVASDAPKVVIGAIGAFLVWCLAVPASKAARLPFSRREAAFLLICIGLIPMTAGFLKKTTGVFGPWKITRYGGEQPYRTLFASIPHVAGRERGRGFPAAHCSGAFALMGLYFVGKTPRARRWGLAVGLLSGWIVAWLMIQLLARAFELGGTASQARAA